MLLIHPDSYCACLNSSTGCLEFKSRTGQIGLSIKSVTSTFQHLLK